MEKTTHDANSNAKKRRILSFVFGGIALVICVIIGVLRLDKTDNLPSILLFAAAPFTFTFISCLILNNNVILDIILEVLSWGFVKFPGLIFTLDLDGILWFITVKLLLFVLGLILAILVGILAIALGMFISIFVYPFALGKNIRKPEEV